MVNSKLMIMNEPAAKTKHTAPNVTVYGSKLKMSYSTNREVLVTKRPQTKCVERPTKGKKMKTVWRVDLCLTPHYRDTGLSRVSSATSGQPRVVTPA